MKNKEDQSVSDMIDDNCTIGELDPSFISFVNTTENAVELQPAIDVVFHNQALFKHIG